MVTILILTAAIEVILGMLAAASRPIGARTDRALKRAAAQNRRTIAAARANARRGAR